MRGIGHLDAPLETVYIGGGTPTELPAEALRRLVGVFHGRLAREYEWTVEANPVSVTPEKVEILGAAGVNRISLGVQSAEDPVLARLGRLHRHRDTLAALACLRDAGFENISGDLIFGLPGEDIEATLGFFAEQELAHVSAYELVIEGNSAWKLAGLDPSDPDEVKVEKMQFIVSRLAAAGYRRYEISNFARPGRECRHNLNTWQCGEFEALGAGACGCNPAGRYRHVPDAAAWLAGAAPENEPIANLAADTVLLALRLIDGLPITKLSRPRQTALHAHAATIAALVKRGLLVDRENHLQATPQGLLFLNDIIMEFL